MHLEAKMDRIKKRCYGEVVHVFDDEEPCFDFNDKNYIKREDLDAEKFKVKRMRATVARSIELHEYKQEFTGHNKKVMNRRDTNRRTLYKSKDSNSRAGSNFRSNQSINRKTSSVGFMPESGPSRTLKGIY